MPRNKLAIVEWATVGPRALAWLGETAPRRHTYIGLPGECADALKAPGLTADRLQGWLTHGIVRPQWQAIKATVGTGNGSHALTASVGVPISPAPVGSLRDFVREERLAADRAACPVCRLPDNVRRELADDGVTRALKIRYVERKCGVTLTLANLDAHARHQ